MPELPEVETTRRGIEPHVLGKQISAVRIRQPRLRWPVPAHLQQTLVGSSVLSVRRRGKYLLLGFKNGSLLIHLGMSGSLRVVDSSVALLKHDHFEFEVSGGRLIRLNDPRRFGAVLWAENPVEKHPLLAHLGPEPLEGDFDGCHLYTCSRKRKMPVKTFIMDSKIVVGVGNIYANEALFQSGIRPDCQAGTVSRARYVRLASAIVQVLQEAINQGGTTLRDFVSSDGKPGYFKQKLQVYGRGGMPCRCCGKVLDEIRLSQRATVFCTKCQR